MFRLDTVSTSYLWPIQFQFAGEDGRIQRVEFRARFRRLPQRRIDEIIKDLRSPTPKISDDELIAEVLCGWEEVTSNGEELAYTDANRRLVLDVPGCRGAMVAGWFESISGAPEKN